MTVTQFLSFQVKRFRSLMDVTLDISQDSPTVICGENNIGKTNFLRALNLFFNHSSSLSLYPQEDLPYHIIEGSRGARMKTELIGKFKKGNTLLSIKITFLSSGIIEYQIDDINKSAEEVCDFLNEFRFILIESHNVNLPQLIAAVLEQDGLLPLDKKRGKQSKPLKKLEEFITLSERAIADIEKDINICFEQLTDFDGILKDKKVKIYFAEFEKLRDVVKTMTEITLFDGNSLSIASKGSGAQRALFLALMQYISKNSKKRVIWGVDEPEAFLQPKLQKKVASVFSDIIKNQNQTIIFTTHSQHFIDLKNLESTYLFKGKQEIKEYTRRPGRKFVEMNTSPLQTKSTFEKAFLIKEHLGISSNDGWAIMPYNILVEGEEDKKYLEAIFRTSTNPTPNIIWAGGASKIGGYLQFYNTLAKDLNYKPIVVCLFDNDEEGKAQANKVKSKSLSNIIIRKFFPPRFDGTISNPCNPSTKEWEIEDFMPPELIIKSINNILKKDKYKIINKKQQNDRKEIANVDKRIFQYAEECITSNNPTKKPFSIDNEGRKKQICMKVCEILQYETWEMTDQINFLTEIAK